MLRMSHLCREHSPPVLSHLWIPALRFASPPLVTVSASCCDLAPTAAANRGTELRLLEPTARRTPLTTGHDSPLWPLACARSLWSHSGFLPAWFDRRLPPTLSMTFALALPRPRASAAHWPRPAPPPPPFPRRAAAPTPAPARRPPRRERCPCRLHPAMRTEPSRATWPRAASRQTKDASTERSSGGLSPPPEARTHRRPRRRRAARSARSRGRRRRKRGSPRASTTPPASPHPASAAPLDRAAPMSPAKACLRRRPRPEPTWAPRPWLLA
mmetsp:Transcript_4721/g.17847  ORF Transcript_4721/g.17847 Transcript_4721/m.17847 type:complete len:271 (+) Transcript_4721:4269-5081(+)